MVVRRRQDTYTVTRLDSTSTDSIGDVSETTSTHEEDAWLFNDARGKFEDLFGEEVSGDLNGLALDGADLQHDDRLTHDGTEYIVEDEPELVPAEGAKVVRFTLTEKVN
jgi:hypothetical protein